MFDGGLKTWARAYETTPNRLFVISDDGPEARSRLAAQAYDVIDEAEEAVVDAEESGVRATVRCATTTVLLVDCISAHWGGAGPCCKTEAALLHFARAYDSYFLLLVTPDPYAARHLYLQVALLHFARTFRNDAGARRRPAWMIFGEDDLYFHMPDLLATLAYFNSSLSFTLGTGGVNIPKLQVRGDPSSEHWLDQQESDAKASDTRWFYAPVQWVWGSRSHHG